MATEIKSQEELQNFIKEKKLVIIDFYAEYILFISWCGPCKKIKPYLVEKIKENNLNLACINVDQNEELANNFNISSIPQFNICLNTIKNNKKTLMGGNQKVVDQLIAQAIKIRQETAQ